jgi:hypothetical protein
MFLMSGRIEVPPSLVVFREAPLLGMHRISPLFSDPEASFRMKETVGFV